MLEKISSEDVSVIIQGPTLDRLNGHSQLLICIESIRRVLPLSEIIVSTWEYESCASNVCDQVIRSVDPGALISPTLHLSNYNRMVVSTLAGIESATRSYVLKFRADLVLENDEILVVRSHSDMAIDENLRILKQKITTTNIFARNPASHAPLLYHPSDTVQFGLRSDMKDLWNRKLIHEGDLSIERTFRNSAGFLSYTGFRLVPEQTLMIGWLRFHGVNVDVAFPGYMDKSNIKKSEISLVENFHIIDWRRSGIKFPTRFVDNRRSLSSIYSESQFEELRTIYSSSREILDRLRDVVSESRWKRFASIQSFIDLMVTPIALYHPQTFNKLKNLWRNSILNLKG